MPNYKKVCISQTPHLHNVTKKEIVFLEFRISFFSAQQNMIEWGQTIGSLTRQFVCLNLTTTKNRYFSKHAANLMFNWRWKTLKFWAVKEHSCTFIICINAALNHCFLLPLLFKLASFEYMLFPVSHPPKIAFCSFYKL